MTVIHPKTRFTAVAAMMTILLFAPATIIAAEAPAGQIAQVNDTILLRPDLDREMKLVSLKLARQGRPVNAEQLKRYEGEIRDTLINRTLLLQQAKSAGIDVKDSAVVKALDEFKAAFKDEKAYQNALTEMGFTEEMLKSQIKSGLTIKTLIDKTVLQKISVSDQQVRVYYDDNPNLFRKPEQVKASHILIQVPANADEAKQAAAQAAIQALKLRLNNGENFATLAQENSDGPSKTKGGDLGFFSREQMVPPFSEAAFALQPGQTSDVVQTRFGYHLIRVTERQAEQTMAYNEVKEAISARLRQEQEGKKIDAYLEKIKENADIKRFPL
ncbi:peptidylprolyl isomerase [Desulfosarcina sp.]|uniref:peptidylprolyl isomerase n=1 Tax=Desulfosarcina sp. TaxID=2027861 RepID=UPI0029A0BA52|nr:peptidylprolyl isomerase [Desulfosarcina sp.]MDX2454491.1 peptidylprolyl isomerase [Desulfosarcina sp.]MDX2492126.1 peptidylprolyl isomerase [Desulfosarcina sp.]